MSYTYDSKGIRGTEEDRMTPLQMMGSLQSEVYELKKQNAALLEALKAIVQVEHILSEDQFHAWASVFDKVHETIDQEGGA